jgi:DnaJ-class molecular chaperone
MMDPYEILGCKRDDTDETIRKKYHSLAKKYHPDKNSEDTNEKFIEIKCAYEQCIGNTTNEPNWFSFLKKDNLNQVFDGVINDVHLFRDYYNKRKHTFGKHAKKSPPYHIHIRCSIEDIYIGKVKNLKIDVSRVCHHCLGLGRKSKGIEFMICDTCKGQGLNAIQQSLDIYLDKKMQTFPNLGNESLGETKGDILISILPKYNPNYKIINDYDILIERHVSQYSKLIKINMLNNKENNNDKKGNNDKEIDISILSKGIGNKKICIIGYGLLYPVYYEKNRGNLIVSLFIYPPEMNIEFNVHLQKDVEQETYSLILE